MKIFIVFSIILLCFFGAAIFSKDAKKVKSVLITNLENKIKQVVVTYGTSLTSHGTWVEELEGILKKQYPDLITIINSGGSGKWSQWGLDNIENLVISKNPDTVIIEFSMNDSVERFNCSVEKSKENLEAMIIRIQKSNPKCEIILMTMTPGNGDPAKRVKIADYYEAYRIIAKKHQFLLIDHYPRWLELQKKDKGLFDKYVPDSVHPTADGCAKIITPGIVEALGIKIK